MAVNLAPMPRERECWHRWAAKKGGREDLHLLPLLLAAAVKRSEAETGFFMEIGANDGITGSQTLLIEHCYGWRGLLAEGQPANFRKL